MLVIFLSESSLMVVENIHDLFQSLHIFDYQDLIILLSIFIN